VTQPAPWSADELARRALLEQRVAVAVNLRRQDNLIAWARERALLPASAWLVSLHHLTLEA
jgi:hypothetical protein